MKNLRRSLSLFIAGAALSVSAFAADYYFSADYTIAQLLKSPQATQVLEKYIPGMTKSAQLEMAKGLTLRQIAEYPQSSIDAAKLQKINDELSKIKADEPVAD